MNKLGLLSNSGNTQIINLMDYEMNKGDINRLWFDFYTKELENSPKSGHKMFDKYFLCPCCHFPTLTERQGFEICSLCNWEDDGQDDHNANMVLGGPNQGYSLKEARENFKNYLTSYRPTDKYHFERTTVKTLIKRQIIDKYNSAMASTDITQRKQLLDEIVKLKKRLY